ncbi:NC domain-containing protein [Limnoraphis robusta]|uniref:NC domain-containing protein n=1 Tax=Limnoraphis robusta CS-951 TaxID=1637645 RepID=A0A0F5YH98_9CYAN|nr:NC domain-containing protein [Limnoraphis robusta]KKD38266.1 NC domain-containing protein [Limnoraphis robusta CS-951]
MTTSIYSIPIATTAGIARHFFISADGTFENSIGWGPKGIEFQGQPLDLTPEQEQRLDEYSEKFGEYNIYSNNCEMFAWYILTGKRYSGQTQERIHTAVGAIAISAVQPILTVRGMKYYQYEQAIIRRLNEDNEELKQARKQKLESEQAARDDFWKRRDAGLI